MAYFHPNTAVIKHSAGDFKIKNTGEPYSGPYIATNDNRYFIGDDLLFPGPELMIDEEGGYGITGNFHVRKYNAIFPTKSKRILKLKPVIPSKTIPTEKDYKKGYFYRYFCVKTNQLENIFEISKKHYHNITKKKIFDVNLYKLGVISWALKGDVVKSNFNTVKRLKNRDPKLKYITKLFIKLDEFYRSPDIEKSDCLIYNIKNRFYVNGEIIPSSLPPSYGVPAHQNKCKGCAYFAGTDENPQLGYYNKWCALVKNQYWCKSFQPDMSNAADMTFEDYQSSIGETDLFISTETAMQGGTVITVGEEGFESGYPPIGRQGAFDGEEVFHDSSGHNYRWQANTDSWIVVTTTEEYSSWYENNPYHPFIMPGNVVGEIQQFPYPGSGYELVDIHEYTWDGVHWIQGDPVG